MKPIFRILLAFLALVLAAALGVGAFLIARDEAPETPVAEPPEGPVLPRGEPIVIRPRGNEPASRGTLGPDDDRDLLRPAEERAGARASAARFERSGACALPAALEAGSGFLLHFQDEVSPFRLIAAFAMPGETLEVEAELTRDPALVRGPGGGGAAPGLEAEASGGRVEVAGAGAWRWRAPEEPGVYCLRVAAGGGGEEAAINLFVLSPYDGQDVFEGYRIGSYERVPLRGREAYRLPPGLVRVTPELAEVQVSPHFRLGQFLCKQESSWPKFLLLSTRLLLKLETLLERVNDAGVPAETFFVMSGYRTPHYNASIGNRTTYSRHLYGDAADVFVDDDGDGVMDDLDGDGRADRGDAELLARIVEEAADDAWYAPFVGGLSVYGATAAYGPFVHVDTRGFRARW